MAETFAFELRLVDSVTAAARKASEAVRGIESQAAKTGAALDFSKEISRVQASIEKLAKDPKGYQALIKAQKELVDQRKALGGPGGLTGALKDKFSFGFLASATAAGDLLAEGVMKAGEFMVDSAKRVAEIVIDGFKRAVEKSGKEETRRLAYRLTLGKEGGTSALGDVERFSKQTQFTRTQSAAMLLPLLRAGFSQKSARQEFATAADVQAGGGMSAEEFLGFAQHVKLKGGVTTKQLVGAGINAPEFFKSLSKKLGISEKEVEKRAKEGGKIDPQLILNEITDAVNKRQGGAAGTGAAAASKTLEARLAKLRDLPNEYLAKLVDSPSFGVLSDKIGSIVERLDPESPQGQRIIAALDRVFTKIVGWFDELATEDGIDSLVTGFESVITVVSAVLSFVKDTVAEINKLIDGVKVLADISIAVTGSSGAVNAIRKANEDLATQKANRVAAARGNETVDRANSPWADAEGFNGPLNDNAPMKRAKGGKIIQMNAPISIVVQPAKDDVAHTGQKAAQEIHRHVSNALGRAVNEGGG